jgi:uncharacterized membrane protein
LVGLPIELLLQNRDGLANPIQSRFPSQIKAKRLEVKNPPHKEKITGKGEVIAGCLINVFLSLGTRSGVVMNEYQEINDDTVNRQEETLVTHYPGFSATEQVVRDVAAERRIGMFQFNRIMWSILVLLEILLAFRFILRMIAANPDSGFAVLMYGITGLFVGPFNGLIATPTSGESSIEVTTLIAMLVYALFFWGVAYVIQMIMDRPSARSFTRTTHEQTPGGEGNERTTYTTISNNKM